MVTLMTSAAEPLVPNEIMPHPGFPMVDETRVTKLFNRDESDPAR